MTYQLLKDRKAIVDHLRAVVQGQTRVAIRTGRERQEHLSQILRLDDGGTQPNIVLDPYGRPGGGTVARPGDAIRCEYKHGDQSWTFVTTVVHVSRGQEPAVFAPLPTVIETHQQRRHFRVEPSPSRPVAIVRLDLPAAETPAEENAEQTVVVDVSAGGICFNINANRYHILPGTKISKATLTIPDHEPFEVEMIIRSMREAPGKAYRWRVGAEFQDLDPLVQEAISRYVTRKQREDIRHFKREMQ